MIKWIKLIAKLFFSYIDFNIFIAGLSLILCDGNDIWQYFICIAAGYNFATKFLGGD